MLTFAAALFALHGMASVPAGSYQPLYGTAKVHVSAFQLDNHQVTRGEIHGRPATDASQPMTNVSRIDAEAYCAARGKRLPTIDEWEYAATLGKVGKAGDPWEWTAAEQHHHHHEMHDASCAGAAIGAADPTNYLAFQRFAVRSALSDSSTMRALGFRCAV